MAAPPPHPPQNTGQYPPPNPPLDPRRQARAYARAQRDQMKAQRHYWRNYWRGGRPSIVGPLLILAIGIIALLVEIGQLNGYAIWSWYVQWWPLLLIGLGVVLLGEYFWDRGNPYVRRRTGGGIVFLIALLLFLGWGAHGAQHWGRHLGANGNDFWFMFGQEHDNDVQMNQAAAANGAVNIQVPRGDVTITPSNDGQIHLQAHEVVHTSSDRDAQNTFKAIHPQMTAAGSGITITVPQHRGSSVDLTLAVPETSAITVNAGHGDVSMEGLKGNAYVTNANGDVKFDGISGDVHAQMSDGDFSAHAITGQVLVNGHVGDATLSEVTGQAVLDGEFFGATHLEQMGGGFHFHSSRSSIDVPKLDGDLTLDSDDLEANQTSGPVRIVTRSKNIELTQASGDIHIENSDGDVNVTTAAPLGNVEVANQTGDVSVTVPENANFAVTASTTEDEDLDTDFQLQTATSGDRKQASGTVGRGGVTLNLTTTHGNLELKKGMAQATLPPPPHAPAGPVRHLRVPKTPVAPVQQ